MLLHEIIESIVKDFLGYFETAVEQRSPNEASKREYMEVAKLFDEIMDKIVETKITLTRRPGLAPIVVVRDISPQTEINYDRCRHYIKILRALYTD